MNTDEVPASPVRYARCAVRDAVCSSPVDLAFLLDSSGSVDDDDRDGWRRMLDFVSSVIRQFDVGDSTAHVGLIRYSDNAEVIFYLNYSRLNSSLLPVVPLVTPTMSNRIADDSLSHKNVTFLLLHFLLFLVGDYDDAAITRIRVLLPRSIAPYYNCRKLAGGFNVFIRFVCL